MKAESFIGWDIGGAHLKMAHIDDAGRVVSASQFPVPVWKGLEILENSLLAAKKHCPTSHTSYAVTTTAELADIFDGRRSGLAQLAHIISAALDRDSFRFYGGSAGWISADQTDQYAREIASANWHATASFVAGRIGDGILVDIGSTTTDIVPFSQGRLLNQGYTDYERLSCAELVYTGMVRTPVMAIVNEIPIDGHWRPVIPEHFATMADIYRLTGDLQEQDDMMPAADGAGKTKFESARRLARMVAIDITHEDDLELLEHAAVHIAGIQQGKIVMALDRILNNITGSGSALLVGAGAGRLLVKKIAQARGHAYLDFADILDAADEIRQQGARSAAAIAVAHLLRSET